MSGWLIETLVATTVLMAVVLALRPLVRRAFGAGAAYALWLVPALRLVLPPIPGPTAIAPNMSRPVEIVMAATEPASGAGGWLLTAWALGALMFMGWHMIGYRRFVRLAMRDASPCAGPGVRAVMTDAVAGPAAIGLFSRRTLLPRDFQTRFDPAERELALRHERVHHARGDLWANAGALGVLGLHWFNPVAHVAYRAFREDQELSCDAAVIGRAGAEKRAVYAAAMVKSAQSDWGIRAAPPFTCPMSRTGNLVRRLKMLKTHRKSAWATAGGMATVGEAALAGLTLTATGAIAADPVVLKKTITVKRLGTQADGKATADALIAEHCGTNDSFQTEMPGTPDGKTTKRVVFCAKPGTAPAVGRVTAVERARASLASASELTPAERAEVAAGLDALIAKAKAEQ